MAEKVDITSEASVHSLPVTTDRRAFLAANPALALITAGPTAATCEGSQLGGIDQAIAAYWAADEQASAFEKSVFDPALHKWEALCDAIPHYTTSIGYDAKNGQKIHLRTDRLADVAVAQGFIRQPYGSAGDDFGRCCVELADAIDRRDADVARLKAEMRIEEIGSECDRLNHLAYQEKLVVDRFPVRTFADLLKKVDFIDATDEEADVAEILADLRRIEDGRQ